MTIALSLAAAMSLTACGDKSTSSTSPATSTSTTKFRIESITLPAHGSDFALDLDGDATADNQFGTLMQGLGQGGLLDQTASQDSVNTAIASGRTTLLLSVTTHDSSLTADQSMRVTLYRGVASSSTAAASIDQSTTAAVFTGTLTSHQFTSTNPAKTTQPVAVTLHIPIFGRIVAIPLNGAHIQFTTSTSVAGHTLVSGEIQGSIKTADIDSVLLPGFTANMNAIIQADPSAPSGSTARTILNLFDGGCTPSTQGTSNDGIISACEVVNNNVVHALLLPDVKIYNGSGAYAPSPSNTSATALSFAIGFTATVTTF